MNEHHISTVGWSFLLSKRWLGYLGLALVFALACSLLGSWQFARRAAARLEITRVAQNYDADPVPLSSVLDSPSAPFDENDRWLPVLLKGEYLAEKQLLVRNRPRQGYPGFEILTPLRLANGTVFIVDRGWLPTGSSQDLPDWIPEAPSGPVTVVARLKPGEPELAGRTAAEGQISSVLLSKIRELINTEVYTGAYGLLAAETPPAEAGQAALRPVPDEGPHLSYALQWFVFALMAFLGLGALARQEYRRQNADDPDERRRAAARDALRAQQSRTDAEIEDELIDQAFDD